MVRRVPHEAEAHRLDGCCVLTQRLQTYYRDLGMGRHTPSRVNVLTPQMIRGKNVKHPCMKTKGMETRLLVQFAYALASEHVGRLGRAGPHLVGAGAELLSVYALMHGHGADMGPVATNNLVESGLRHLGQYKQAGCHLVPKHHAFVHLLQQVHVHGNPRVYTTYMDESLNGKLASVGRHANVKRLAETLLRKFELA